MSKLLSTNNITFSACSDGEFRCGNQCVNLNKFCDGEVNCLDGTDEPAGCA